MTRPSQSIIWFQAGGCSGDTMSLLSAENLSWPELVERYNVDELWHPSLTVRPVSQFLTDIEAIKSGEKALDILCVEGSLAQGPNNTGLFDTLAERPKIDIFRELAEHARYIVAIGTCASFGGVTAAPPNPTEATGLQSFKGQPDGALPADWVSSETNTPVINISGCPTHPKTIIQTLQMLLMNQSIPLNAFNQPEQFYNMMVHQGCSRNEYHEYDIEESEFGKEGCLQPKIDINTGNIIGAEALIRWNSEKLGFVSPEEFISVAELSGQIIEIGLWVVKTTMSTISHWKEKGISVPKIAINLSAIQLRDEHFAAGLASELKAFKLAPEVLELEITETAAMSEPEVAAKHLRQLQSMGFTIAMDDFGTGYSSLSYLSNLPINRVKIDRSFVSDLDTSDSAKAIIESIIKMSKVMNKLVIAEGVETEEQLNLLRSLGCDEAQGYFIAQPLPEKDFCRFLSEYQMPA